ncbi:MAG: hypothetical protein DRJ67_12260, partial [Thermoprotei archaeon]
YVLRNQGYIVIRSAGSKTPVDLVAINPTNREILLIQVKTGKSRLSPEEREVLRNLNGTYEVKAMTTVREGKRLKLVEVR